MEIIEYDHDFAPPAAGAAPPAAGAVGGADGRGGQGTGGGSGVQVQKGGAKGRSGWDDHDGGAGARRSSTQPEVRDLFSGVRVWAKNESERRR